MRRPRRRTVMIPVGGRYARLRDQPLYRRGRRDGWLDGLAVALIVIGGFVIWGFLVRGVLS